MPNWCRCELTVEGPKADVDRFMELAQDDGSHEQRYRPYPDVDEKLQARKRREMNPLCFNKLYPVPDKIQAGSYDPDGYDWEHANWGCKWGACSASLDDVSYSKGEGYLRYTFDTPWQPPKGLVMWVSLQFPTLTFEMEWEEEAMLVKGSGTWKAGKYGKG